MEDSFTFIFPKQKTDLGSFFFKIPQQNPNPKVIVEKVRQNKTFIDQTEAQDARKVTTIQILASK